MTSPSPIRRLLLVLAAAGACLAVAPLAGAATSASLEAKSGCDLQVINDWADNGRIDKIYAVPCYTQAIQRLNSYPDIAGYSDAPDVIHDALLAAIRQDRGGGDGTSGGSGPSSPSGPRSPSGNSGDGPPTSSKGPISGGIDTVGPSSATSIPVPLLVLGGLAILLLLTALGTWLARRYQSRRGPRPATASGPRR